MKNMIRIFTRLHNEESGQDLIEYALVVALIALAATAGMQTLATGINSAFTAISGILGKYIS
ncbi:MAG: Flp family type IVb pilin [Candidatus Angelobacter sp.]